jgi:HK97 family phage major capsid protein
MDRIKKLRNKKAALLAEANELVAKMDAGTITAEETARLNAITSTTAATETAPEVKSELAQINAEIDRELALMDERRSMESSANANADTAAEAAARLSAEARQDPPKFKSLGEQMLAIASAGMPSGRVDSRLVIAAGPTGMNEGVGSEGGFLVQTDFQNQLLDDLYAGGDLLKLINPIPLSANSNGILMNGIDETSRANGSRAGGIQAFWTGEAQLKRDSTPKFRQLKMELDKLTGLCYATDELLQDTTALESWIKEAFNTEFTFKLEDAIINGTGAGMPLGILNSGAVVTVTKETSQPNGTLNQMNILKMWSRLPPRSRKNAVWLINGDVEPQFGVFSVPITNVAGTENVGGFPAYAVNYTPPGKNGEYATLQGRPVIVTEYNNTLGGVGDIILFDPTQYLAIDKGPTQSASSIHVRFVYDETVFRFVYRFNGQPKWRTARTPYKGTNTTSPFVVLGAR